MGKVWATSLFRVGLRTDALGLARAVNEHCSVVVRKERSAEFVTRFQSANKKRGIDRTDQYCFVV